MSYSIRETPPDVDDYRRLRADAGLSPRTREAAERGLPNTLLGVTVEREGRAVGMGRVIGDGGSFYQLVDIAVEPDHQGRGLGTRIVENLVDRLREDAPESAYVSLVADVEGFYERFGFEPVAPESAGMALRIG